MNSNSKTMTLEEKLVQQIKTGSLAALVDDEDAILELTKRAINEALLQPRRVETGTTFGRSRYERDGNIISRDGWPIAKLSKHGLADFPTIDKGEFEQNADEIVEALNQAPFLKVCLDASNSKIKDLEKRLMDAGLPISDENAAT